MTAMSTLVGGWVRAVALNITQDDKQLKQFNMVGLVILW